MPPGRVAKAILLFSHAFLRPVMASTGNWGWVFVQLIMAGTGVNGLNMIVKRHKIENCIEMPQQFCPRL